jgi:hypothetical protein
MKIGVTRDVRRTEMEMLVGGKLWPLVASRRCFYLQVPCCPSMRAYMICLSLSSVPREIRQQLASLVTRSSSPSLLRYLVQYISPLINLFLAISSCVVRP